MPSGDGAPPSLRPIIETARAAPPELFAEAVLRMAETGAIPIKALQIELLDEAFHAAANAKEPVRLIAIPATPPDTRATYRGRAGDLKLDALSLQSRILKQLITLDPPKARELFEQIVHPAQDLRTCEDPLLPDLSAYYEIAGALAQSAFTPAEKSKEVNVQFLLSVLAQVNSPADLVAFARALESVQLKSAQLELLLATFAKTMESMAPYFRSFSVSTDPLQSEIKIETMTSRAASARVGADALVKAYRKFLVTQLTAARCAEEFQRRPASRLLDRYARLALDSQRIRPSNTEGAIKADPYFQSTDSKQLGAELRQLTSSDRSSPEWTNRLADFTRDYSAWQPSGDTMDVFHQRATILAALLGVTPPGEDRDRIVEMTAAFLESSDAEAQSPAEWLWQVKTLLNAAGADAPKMTTSFKASGNPALTLY